MRTQSNTTITTTTAEHNNVLSLLVDENTEDSTESCSLELIVPEQTLELESFAWSDFPIIRHSVTQDDDTMELVSDHSDDTYSIFSDDGHNQANHVTVIEPSPIVSSDSFKWSDFPVLGLALQYQENKVPTLLQQKASDKTISTAGLDSDDDDIFSDMDNCQDSTAYCIESASYIMECDEVARGNLCHL